MQGSAPNTSFIKIEKDGEAKDLMTYDSFGTNNVSVTFKRDSIIIEGLDEQTSGLLNRADLKIKDVFGYKISVRRRANT